MRSCSLPTFTVYTKLLLRPLLVESLVIVIFYVIFLDVLCGNYLLLFWKKSKWLNEYNLNKPKFYLRCVNDILSAFDKKQDSLNFFNFLTKKHLNIKFLIEKPFHHFSCDIYFRYG